MCAPPIVIGIISAGLGFIQNQQMIAAQNRAIEVQNQNARAQFDVAKLQTEANRFREQQQFQSQELANETSEFLADRAFEKETQSINLQIAQAQEEAAIKKREKKLEATKAKGEIEVEETLDEETTEIKTEGCGCNEEKAMATSLTTELNETKAALNAVKGELNEVNLLNSKLLYVNRIFKANNLSESQKLRVVETLDNASSVKEAKLIYETVKDTFTISKKKKTTSKKSIRENFGMASKATLTSAPRKSVLNESNDMVARMQKLANISKIK